MSLPDIMKRNRDKLFKHGKEFQQTFGVPLNKYLDPMTGFDIVKFDEWLKTPDGTSTPDWLTKKYSAKASELVRSLL
jgi:hypothetical protein